MHRYTLDTVSRSLVFDKTDASLLGCGSSAIVYKGVLDDKPVAVKVWKARTDAMPAGRCRSA